MDLMPESRYSRCCSYVILQIMKDFTAISDHSPHEIQDLIDFPGPVDAKSTGFG
jgi:hypothetical protein